jgi:Ca2+-binding RTX toxin-like protein
LVGADGNDQLFGGEGKDYLIGGEGADLLHGGAGTGDTAVYTNATSGVGVDLTNGGYAGEATGDTYVDIEYVDGSDFDDTIIGDDGQNRLIGQAGNDTIVGGAGNDYIIGMQDDDILTGGIGDDVFLYKSLFGNDVITDFEAGIGRTDRIWLDLDGIEDMSDLTITDTANGALIEVDGYGTILLENVNAADLVADDFIF